MVETPAHIQPYVEALGSETAAIDFLLKFGGAPVHVTPRPVPDSEAVREAGLDTIKALGKKFGAVYLRVPTAKPWIAQTLYASGVGIYAIARQLHVTDTTVRKYVRPKEEQLDLF